MTTSRSSAARLPGRRPGRVLTWSVPQVVTGLDVIAKSVLVVMLGLVLVDPGWGNLEGKAPAARAVTYPLLSFAVPVAWWARGRRSAFPWTADLMVTLTCFTDILGNRLDLYDTIEWFDDWMHFMNTGLLSAAAVLLTVPRTTSVRAVVERGVAVGASVALAWELFEYISFVTTSPEAPTAYADTIWDLVLGWLGAFTASVIVHAVWRQRPVSRAALAPAPAPAPRR